MDAAAAVLVDKVAQCLRHLEIRPLPMVVAVSGGPDSLALLRSLLSWRTASQASSAQTKLIIAHLNHQLRGAESDEDEEFVRAVYAAQLGIGVPNLELRMARIDVAERARELGENLESVARRVRYHWLLQTARDAGTGIVATGHTANDQAETVLHRILRGSGLKGLAGIARRRSLGQGVDLVRPMLEVTRGEVLSFLAAAGQAYRCDSSNERRCHTRNRIRHELLPNLAEEYNPAIVKVLCRLAEQAGEASREWEQLACDLLTRAELPRAGSLVVFDVGQLAIAPRQLVREALRLAWSREGWPQGHMGFREWDRLAAVALGELSAADFPGPIQTGNARAWFL